MAPAVPQDPCAISPTLSQEWTTLTHQFPSFIHSFATPPPSPPQPQPAPLHLPPALSQIRYVEEYPDRALLDLIHFLHSGKEARIATTHCTATIRASDTSSQQKKRRRITLRHSRWSVESAAAFFCTRTYVSSTMVSPAPAFGVSLGTANAVAQAGGMAHSPLFLERVELLQLQVVIEVGVPWVFVVPWIREELEGYPDLREVIVVVASESSR